MESLNPSHAVSSLNASFSIWLSDVRQVAQPLWCHFFIYKMRYYLQLLQICVWTRQRAWASLVAQTVKNLPVIWDLGLIPGLGRSPGGAQGNLLQHSCLENPMGRSARQATVHRVTQSQTWLKGWLNMHAHNVLYSKWIHASNDVHWLTIRQSINGLWAYEGTPLLPAV